MDNRAQKIIICILIFSQLVFWPALTFAQTLANPLGPINAININNSGSLVANNTFNALLTPILATASACDVTEKAFEVGDNTSTFALSFSALIGGGGALVSQLTLELNAYNIYLACKQTELTALNGLLASNSYLAGIKQQQITQVNATIQTYKTKITTAQARWNVANQGVWKALLITILINTTKTVADALVNHLVSNYKIANLKQYTDSVATLMYDNQFIRDNFPNNQDQLMARAILTNPLLRTQIQPAIYQEANSFLNPTTVNYNDPNFYAKMGLAGSPAANPYFMQAAFVSSVDQSHAGAVSSAQQQIAQGNGYKAPVNCSGSLAQQKQIDAQDNAAQTLLANRQGLLATLQSNPKSSPADIAKAQADVNAANTALQNLPYTVSGNNAVGNSSVTGGNNTEGSTAIIMCEAISSPAILINQGIDAVIKNSSVGLGQYNTNNLPGSLASIANIATQIGSSLILGGTLGSGGSTASVLNENQTLNAAANIAGNAVFPPTTLNQAAANGGVIFNSPIPNYSNGTVTSYSLTWQVLSQVTGASYVTISGNGVVATTHQPLTGGIAVPASSSGSTYVLNVYGVTPGSAPLFTTTVAAPPTNTQQSLNYNPNGPTVAGAFTQKPALEIRGPMPTLTPRGSTN